MNTVNIAYIRVLSIVAFVLFLAVFAVGLHLAIKNLGLVALYVVALAVGPVGGWLMLAKRGLAWAIGVILISVAALLFVVATWVFLTKPGNAARFLLLAGLVVVYIALVGVIARKYWQVRRRRSRGLTAPAVAAPLHKAVLIINPKSGDGRAVKAHIAERARAMGISVAMMGRGQDMVALARAAVEQDVELLGVSGGDGSLGAVAGVAIEHNVPLVVLPGGTRCHFARDIGMDPARIADALEAFRGVERRVDVGKISDRVFLNNASFGLYAETISMPEYRDHKLDTTLKVARELISADEPYYPIKFHDSQGREWDRAAQVLVGVNRYETTHLGELGERKLLDEGVLQVIAMQAMNEQMLRHLARNVRIDSDSIGPVRQWTTQAFTVSHPSGQVRVGVDGESLVMASPVQMKILPGGLTVLVPPEGVRSRPIRPLSIKGARTLLGLGLGKNA